MINDIILVIMIFTGITYLFMMLFAIVGWNKLPVYNKKKGTFNTKVSIIIPARNEQDNIKACLTDILKQDYPFELFQVIVVDDNSNDNTNEIIQEIKNANLNSDIIHIRLNNEHGINAHKKLAIAKAVEVSNGELIITTDADCRMGINWVSAIVEHYEMNNSKMIISPVNYSDDNTIFGKLQNLEFLSLIGSSAAAAYYENPIMCNGANLAYQKEAFIKLGGYGETIDLASGDDIFMLHKFKKAFPKKITFLKSLDAIVFTKPKKTIKEFINQRIRWASKSKRYTDASSLIIAFIVLLFNLSIFISLAGGIFSIDYLNVFIFLFSIKLLFDFIFLYGVTYFFRCRKLLLLYLPLQLLYFLYIIIVSILSINGKYEWKGRIVK